MHRFVSLVIVFTCFSSIAFAQDKMASSIQNAVNQHISELKKYITGYDNIFLVTKIDDQLSVSEKVLKVENGLNAKMIEKKDKNYLIVVRVSSQSEYLKLEIINYSVLKVSNKKLHLINLNNGSSYMIGK